jgi:hypothetical protein
MMVVAAMVVLFAYIIAACAWLYEHTQRMLLERRLAEEQARYRHWYHMARGLQAFIEDAKQGRNGWVFYRNDRIRGIAGEKLEAGDIVTLNAEGHWVKAK